MPADTSRDSTSRRARQEGPRDTTVKTNWLYNTSSLVKGVADVYRRATGQDKKPTPKPKKKK